MVYFKYFADSRLNKREVLISLEDLYHFDIIIIIETLTKIGNIPISKTWNWGISGYNLYTNDPENQTNRGIAIYVKL